MSAGVVAIGGLVIVLIGVGVLVIDRKWPGKLTELAGKLFPRKDAS